MLKIVKLSEKPCFLTGATEKVVEVKFQDQSFSGAISWAALWDILKRKSAQAENDEKGKDSKTEKPAALKESGA